MLKKLNLIKTSVKDGKNYTLQISAVYW